MYVKLIMCCRDDNFDGVRREDPLTYGICAKLGVSAKPKRANGPYNSIEMSGGGGGSTVSRQIFENPSNPASGGKYGKH